MDTSINFDSTKQLLNNSTLFYIICTGTDGNYSYVNNHYASRFSYINPNFVGQPYYITMHPDDRKVCEEAGGKCYENPGMHFPAIIRKHDGKGGYVSTQWEFTLMEENGKPVGIFCVGYDITEFINIKNNAVLLNNDLKSKIELLGAIAFQQSHFITAPLARIMGLIDVLQVLNPDTDAAAITVIVNLLKDNGIQLDDLIKDIILKTGL